MRESEAVRRGNVVRFFDDNGIDRIEFEQFALRPFAKPFDAYYVSTVARGLAGSKSDIDIVLASGGTLPDDATLSNMLFHSGRRVGVRMLSRSDIDSALAHLATVARDLAAGRSVRIAEERGHLAVKWSELERLINGVGIENVPSFLDALPDLCHWALIGALQDFEIAFCCAQLSARSDNAAAVAAYGFTALIAATDAILASCGNVQSNAKWVLERWRLFKTTKIKGLDALANAVAQVRFEIDAPVRRGAAALMPALMRLRVALHERFRSGDMGHGLVFALPTEVKRAAFLPGADCLARPDRTIIVADKLLDQLIGMTSIGMSALDSRSAGLALTLVQQNCLEIIDA